MSLRAVYPLTSTMMVVGVLAIGYGGVSGSFLMIAEGFFLVWLTMILTLSMMKNQS